MMAHTNADAGLVVAVANFLDCLPRPFIYAPGASPRHFHRIVVPSAGLIVVALDHHAPAARTCAQRVAMRTGRNAIVLSRHPETPGELRFDLALRREGRWTAFANYAFREAARGGVFTPVRSGPLVRLEAGVLSWGDEMYFRTASGEVAAIDRAASGQVRQLIEIV